MRVPFVRVFIAKILFFKLDTSVRETSHQLGLSYYTVYDIFDLFRQSIARTDIDPSFTLSGEIEMDESYLGGGEKETETGELQEDPVLVSWSAGETYGLRFYRMSLERFSSTWR